MWLNLNIWNFSLSLAPSQPPSCNFFLEYAQELRIIILIVENSNQLIRTSSMFDFRSVTSYGDNMKQGKLKLPLQYLNVEQDTRSQVNPICVFFLFLRLKILHQKWLCNRHHTTTFMLGDGSFRFFSFPQTASGERLTKLKC